MGDRPRRGEGGFAMVTVIGVLFLGLLLGAVALDGVQPGVAAALRDQHSRRAVQAALSGLELGHHRLNAFSLDLGALMGGEVDNICLGELVASGAAGAAGGHVLVKQTVSAGSWCPPVTIDLGTGTTATYQLSPVTTTIQSNTLLQTSKLLQRRIVATGTADGVTRRVYLEVSATGTLSKSLGLITGGTLQAYRTVAGSFRECRSVAVSSSAPDADC
jgi:hypothetical protein